MMEAPLTRGTSVHATPPPPTHATPTHTPHSHNASAHTPQSYNTPVHTLHNHTTPAHTPHNHAAPAHTPHNHTTPAHTPHNHAIPAHTPHNHAAPAHTLHNHTTPAHTPHNHATSAHTPHNHATSAHTPHNHATPAHTPHNHATSAHTLHNHTTPAHTLHNHAIPAHTPHNHATSAHIPHNHTTSAHTPHNHATPAHTPHNHVTPTHVNLRSTDRPRKIFSSSETAFALPKSVNVGASTSRGSSSTMDMGGGREARLAQVLRSVPASAMSRAQWATRSDSSSHDLTSRWKSTSSESSICTPQLYKAHQQFTYTTSSSNLHRGSDSTPSTKRKSGDVSAHKISGPMVTGNSGQFSKHTPPHHLGDTTVFPSTTFNTHGSSDSSCIVRRKRPVGSTSFTHGGFDTTGSSTPLPPRHTPVSDQDMTHDDDLGSRDHSEEGASQVVMSVSWSQGKLGAAFYDAMSAQVFVVEDKIEAAPDFWILRTLYREQRPRWLLVGGRQDDRLFTLLRELCGIPPTPLSRSTSTPTQGQDTRAGGSEGQHPPPSDTSAASPAISSSSSRTCSIRVLPMGDFKYELCVRRVLSLVLPGEPEGVSEAERELFVRGKVNTDLVSMTRALGALLRFLDKHGLELVAPTVVMGGTPILGLHVYAMEELAQLDDATAAALQLFSEDQHPSSFKSGKVSASKEGLSVYALLSRTSCPMAAHTLRRVLVRPVVEREVLEARYSAVGWGVDPANLDTLRQLQACLKHITNVPHTMNRLYRGQLSVRDWKILYKSLFNSILVGELCQAQDQDIPIFRQTGEGVTEGLYRATFLIQRIMDMEQSEREARFVVKPGVDTELDEKKRRFNGLGEVMRRVAEVELIHLPEEVESCCIIYLPHVGYLLAFPPSPSLDQTLNAQDYHLPGLEFMFKTADMVLYKSQTCLELDRELGDIQVEIANHETRIMMRLVEVLLQQAQQFLALLHHILMLDCLLAFSVVSRECGWVRPELTEEPVLEIEEARHPLYELCTPTFVANPVRSGRPHQCITLVTGPNASGKTVYLKQVGVLAILAQVGCWVPASRARLRPLEAIIAVTQTTPPVTSALSTFMLDLTRMCTALARATQFSLVIIDEFGAATYENDGAALLTACLDHWCKQALPGHTPNNNRLSREREAGKGTRNSGSRRKGDEDSSRRSSRSERGEGSSRSRGSDEGRDEGPAVQEAPPHVFVSTHLLQVYDHLLYPEAVRCLALEAVEEEGRVVPLYQVTEGRAHTSYAAAVAALAGVPQHLVQRANQVFQCVRGGQLPQRWTLLEDEDERQRCEAVVSLLLSHNLSKDPLHLLLYKIRRCSRAPGPPEQPHPEASIANDSANFRTPLRTPIRPSSKKRQMEEADNVMSSQETSRSSEREITTPLQNCVEVVMSSSPVDASQNSSQATSHTSQDTPHVTPLQPRPQSTPQDRPQSTPQDRPQSTLQDRPQSTPQDRPQNTPQDRPQSTPQYRPQSTPQNRPQSTPQDRPQSTPQDRPQSTPQDRSQSTPQDRPQSTPQDRPQSTPQDRPQSTSQDRPQSTPQNRPQSTPQGRPQSTPQDRPQSTSQDRPHSTPQDRSQSRPQDLLRVTLHPDPQTTPPMTPQTVRQSPLAATLQNTTRTTTKSIFDSPELEGYSLRSVVHSSQRQKKSAMSEVGPHSSSPDRGCVSTSSSSLLLALRTPIYEHPQSPGHTLAPPETPALLRSLPDMRPITQNVLPRNSTRRASVSQTGSHTRRMEPCNTPYLDPCTMKSVITTPVSRVYTPNNGHSSVKIESSTTTIEPYSPTNGPCVLKSESVSPENELHTMRTPDNLGIPRTPKITPNPRFPHLTPVVPHTPKISNGMDTSRRPSARNLILESTLASISIMTEDSQEQESSAAISSCSQESIQLTRQYSLKASSGVL